jgi:hypothetical protein
MNLQQTAASYGKKKFLGVPVRDFEAAGQEQLKYLLAAGMRPSSKVVDLGCGVLRGGYWLIHFLDPGNYHGIEAHQERLEIGIHAMLEPEALACKRPRFDTNARFDTSVFREKFDFFLAYSVWTHASKRQIQTMLDSFLRDSAERGVFLTTYLPATWRRRDYQGDAWHGTSHESSCPGCIYHRRGWIQAECDTRDLLVLDLGRDRVHGQSWLQIARRTL